MTNNENLNDLLTEAIQNAGVNLCKEEKIVDLGEDSDIEIIGITEKATVGNRKLYFRNGMRKRDRTKIIVNEVKPPVRNQQESYIKEEIIISDDSDASGNDISKYSERKPIKVPTRRIPKKNDSLSSITLNCPRCNKTENVFSATITCTCKDCKINMSFVCNKCKHRYESMSALYRHSKLQCQNVLQGGKGLTPVKVFIRKCSKCSHTEKLSYMKLQKKCKTCNIELTYECTVCSKTYTSYSGIYQHSKLQCQQRKRRYYCDSCTFVCTTQPFLLRHLSAKHSELYPPCLQCAKCGKSFNCSLSLRQHELICGIPFYQCKFCPYKPKYQENLRKHLITHHVDCVQQGNFDNAVMEMACNKRGFKDKTDEMILPDGNNISTTYMMSLRALYCRTCKMTTEFNSRCGYCFKCQTRYSFYCTDCSKGFESRQALYRHIRRRHGDQSYQCNQCLRLFSFVGDINEHKKTCGAVPRFECQICFFKTRYKYNLKNHIKKLHNKHRQSYSCDYCTVVYKTFRSYKNHLKNGCKMNASATIIESNGENLSN